MNRHLIQLAVVAMSTAVAMLAAHCSSGADGTGDAGTTANTTGSAGGGDAGAALDCEAWRSEFDVAVASLAASKGGCTTDGDCIVVSDSVDCRGGCGAAINGDKKADFITELKGLGDTWCVDAQTCGNSTPGCTTSHAACRSGTCGLEGESAGCSCSSVGF